MSAQSLDTLLTDFKKYRSDKFQKYYDWNTVESRQPSNIPCDCHSKHLHTCAIKWVDYPKNKECVAQSPCTAPSGVGKSGAG